MRPPVSSHCFGAKRSHRALWPQEWALWRGFGSGTSTEAFSDLRLKNQGEPGETIISEDHSKSSDSFVLPSSTDFGIEASVLPSKLMKREDKIAYGIVALGICIGLPMFIYIINKNGPTPVAKQAQPATRETASAPVLAKQFDAGSIDGDKATPAAKSSASVHQTVVPTIERDHTQTTDHPLEAVTAQPSQGSQRAPTLAPKLSIAVVATLGKEAVVPFVHKYNPSYDPADGQSLLDSLWDSSSGNVKTTIRNPKYDVYIVLRKGRASPSAVGMAFPINKSGWILIPPECIARIITPDKPVSEKVQAGLTRFHGILSLKLYATGDCTGLIQFENGNGMRIDIKEDPKSPESLIFKTTFLLKGSYNVSDFDPELVVAWQDDANTKTSSHGETRSDGWSTFETPRYME